MTNLNPLTEYIDDIENYVDESNNYERGCKLMFARKEFGKEPLSLSQLVPCDKDGKPLELVAGFKYMEGEPYSYFRALKTENPYLVEYRAAMENVLFEGFELINNTVCSNSVEIVFRHFNKGIKVSPFESGAFEAETIEDIAHLNFELTEKGEKELI